MIKQAMTKNSLLLGGFALVVAAALALTDIGTREKRAESIRKVQSQALNEIISKNRHDNDLLEDSLPVDDKEFLKLKEAKTIHIARKGGTVVAFIIPTRAPDGYSGSIDSIVGVLLDGSIAGVRIIKHAETPGLGDKVELKKSPWVLDFNSKDKDNPTPELWKVKKDKGVFDQFTGATITPRAVVHSVYNALLFFEQNKNRLLQEAYAKNSPSSDTSDVTEVITETIDSSESEDNTAISAEGEQ